MAEVKEEWSPCLDAVIAAPRNHRVLMEGETIRVLEVTVDPGEREALHHHRWPSLMVVLARPSYVNRDAQGNLIRFMGSGSSSSLAPAKLAHLAEAPRELAKACLVKEPRKRAGKAYSYAQSK